MAADPITAGLNLAGKFVDKFVKDKDLAQKLASNEYAMEFTGELEVMLAQIQVNMAEANSGSLFKGGWRPATGWTCVAALAWQFVLSPLLQYLIETAAWALGADLTTMPKLPALDAMQITPILLGMLGLGAMRMEEKKAGVASK